MWHHHCLYWRDAVAVGHLHTSPLDFMPKFLLPHHFGKSQALHVQQQLTTGERQLKVTPPFPYYEHPKEVTGEKGKRVADGQSSFFL